MTWHAVRVTALYTRCGDLIDLHAWKPEDTCDAPADTFDLLMRMSP